MNKAAGIMIFIAGVAIGSAATWFIAKKKIEERAQEEIASVKDAYKRRAIYDEYIPDEDISSDAMPKTTSEKPDMMEFYKNKIKEEGYVPYSDAAASVPEEKGDTDVKEPYIISPDSFGELDGYDVITLTFYADDALTDDNDDLVDNVNEIIGDINLRMEFDTSDEDIIYVRNEEMKTDYEICRDLSNYSDTDRPSPI